MIVCSCNVLSDQDVRSACQARGRASEPLGVQRGSAGWLSPQPVVVVSSIASTSMSLTRPAQSNPVSAIVRRGYYRIEQSELAN